MHPVDDRSSSPKVVNEVYTELGDMQDEQECTRNFNQKKRQRLANIMRANMVLLAL